jgi:hypothetical protein
MVDIPLIKFNAPFHFLDGRSPSARPVDLRPSGYSRLYSTPECQSARKRAETHKSQQPKAKRMLQDIWMAETRKDADAAFDAFIETYAVKYENAVERLKKDRGRCHINLRRTQRRCRSEYLGRNGCDGFPFGHCPQAMKVR